MLQLGYINDASRIGFIKQRLPVVPVVSDGIIENVCLKSVFCMSQFDQVDLPGLAEFVCGVIGDIDFLPVVPFGIPFIKEPDTLVDRNIL